MKNVSSLFWAVVLVFANFQISAQATLYQIEQFDNTEKQLSNTLAPFLDDQDTIISIVYFAPNSCPRCEGLIDFILLHKKNLGINVKTLGVVRYSKPQAGAKYLDQNQWAFEQNIVDANHVFGNIFQYTNNKLKVPFLMLIDAQKGHLIKSTPLLGIDCNEAFVEAFFTTDLTPAPKVPIVIKEKPAALYTDAATINAGGQFMPLAGEKELTYSEIYDLVIENDTSIFIDDLFNEIYLFDKSGQYLNKLEVKEEEYRYFSSPTMNDEIFSVIRPALRCIYLKLISLSGEELLLSASLPKTSFDTNTLTLNYFNEPVLLKKNWMTNEIIDVQPIEQLPSHFDQEGYILKHSRMQVGEEFIFMPIVRGWPSVGTGGAPPTEASRNPLNDHFYKNAYLGALYSKQGKYLQTIGTLPAIHQTLKSGYFLGNYLFAESQNEILIADKQIGITFVYQKLKAQDGNTSLVLKDSITLFESSIYTQQTSLQNALQQYLDIHENTTDSTNIKNYFTNELKAAANEEIKQIDFLKNSHIGYIVENKMNQTAEMIVFDLKHKAPIYSQMIPLSNKALGKAKTVYFSYNDTDDTLKVYLAFDQGKQIMIHPIALTPF